VGVGNFLHGEIQIWDVTTGQEMFTLRGPLLDVQGPAFSRDGRFLVSARRNRNVRIWDAMPVGEKVPRGEQQPALPGDQP
jgi:hypothetical protein